MNQNEKLLKNIENFENREKSILEKQNKEMYHLTNDFQKRKEFREIINLLKPKQNGKRN